MSLLTDVEIKEALEQKEINITPFNEEKQLKGSSYDLTVGKKGIVGKSITLDELKRKIQREEIREINIEKEESISIPGGSFALINTLESIKLSAVYAGHIGMRSYYARKGLALLSGLQIDPGWNGHLVLGLANLSPRTITLDFKDDLCTIEIHRLNREAGKNYEGVYMADQREGRIPTADKDYLRTIETMSVSDLTKALIDLSSNVEAIGKQFTGFWIGIGIMIFLALFTIVMNFIK